MTVPIAWMPLGGTGQQWLIGVAAATLASLAWLLLCPRNGILTRWTVRRRGV